MFILQELYRLWECPRDIYTKDSDRQLESIYQFWETPKNTKDQIESLRCINLSLIEQNSHLHSELKKYRKNNLELRVLKITNEKKYLDQVQHCNVITKKYENLLYACNIKTEYCPIQNQNKPGEVRRSKRTPKPPRYFSDLY